MEAAELADRRGELEAEIARVQGAIDEASREQEQFSQQQQELNQEAQARSDAMGVRRSEIERQLSAIEPERTARLKAIEAEEAMLEAKMRAIERDPERPPMERRYDNPEQYDADHEDITAQLERIPAARAEVERDLSHRSSELQDERSALEVEAAQANAETGRRVRHVQERATRSSNRVSALQRELERLRESLNTLIAEEKAAETSSEAERLATQKAREVEGQLAAISEDRARLETQLKEMEPLVDAHREATSGQGADDLSKFYVDSADRHRVAWRWCLGLLIASVVLAGVVGLLIVDAVSPGEDPKPSEIFHAIAVSILAIGLLVYLVRMASLQFRVHRHLEAVDRSKAAALRTYHRMVAGATPEVRGALVATLADAVFRTSETGLVDGSADHVTLIERVVGTVSQRAAGPG